MRRAGLIAVAAFVLTTVPAFAQQPQSLGMEIAAMAGYTPAVTLDRHAQEVDEANIEGGFSWALQLSKFITPHWGIEGGWTEQSSSFEISTRGGDAEDLYAIDIGRLRAGVVYQFGHVDAVWQPFVFAGGGATFFGAHDIPGETKFSYDIGGGLKYMKWKNVGMRAQFRYKPTQMNDTSAGDFCDAFGYCLAALRQIDVLAGMVLRF
jgi:opacity protein-like surface antigen